MIKARGLNAFIWGNSIALAWMWGLGLFFSVQMTYMFGLKGLLTFAVPNALGLMLFGFFTQIVADRHPGGQESLSLFFEKFAKPFRLIFYLYQILAITLSVFALVRYLFVPLELATGPLFGLYLCLVVLVILAAGCLFGEEFGIQKIKYSHLVQGLILIVCVGTILFHLDPFLPRDLKWVEPFRDEWLAQRYWGYAIPVTVGLLVGPWLDLQHWQRAIQIHRERTSIRLGYFFGGSIFFLLLLFHGCMAYWVIRNGTGLFEAHKGLDSFYYAHDLVTQYFCNFYEKGNDLLPLAYYGFLGICILTTLDSGYVALKWFLGHNAEKSQNMLLSIVPKQVVGSPIPSFAFAGLATLVAYIVKLELEYFMVFYASFFVGYACLAIARCFVPNSQHPLPQIRMFSMASISVVIFSMGYFRSENVLLILGSIMPIGYVVWLVFNTDLLRVVTERAGEVLEAAASEIPAIRAITRTATAVTGSDVSPPSHVHPLGGHFEGKWFVYSTIATYADTNSVGNVYFGMYAMFVGKTRELFFNTVMPDFDLKTTKFFILTRSFEHKFVREAREFDTITVKIRVSETNRKFCTLEHQIFDSANNVLGKGKQGLLFVSSKDYSLIDIPSEVYTAFMKYI
ncbi:MAG: acyl-CoA thioesterase [Candidatus Methylacidiphilales bacterium]|nr:acyl-CoA thioesterase [Candidatus Methylacidiphilales bacterium]